MTTMTEDDWEIPCTTEPYEGCLKELKRLCGTNLYSNRECIRKHAERLYEKTINLNKCVYEICHGTYGSGCNGKKRLVDMKCAW